ncbi:MAG: glycosyltransferase [Clostridia bacterium]|nr:glycosyltransferase [Clostridia bacterium]
MKVLFLSVTAGNGHNSCANAIDKCLKDRGIETYILDIYGYVNKMLGKTVSEIYSFGISKAPKIYGTIYNMEEDAKLSIGAVMDNINRLATKKIYEFIKENEIDTIITTHVFGGQLITRLKRKKKIDIFSVGVVTDYTIHPHWEKTNLDYYVIADEGLSRQCVEKGIPEKKLLPIGIPLDTKYSVKRDKKEMKKRLGFNPEKNLVFIIMGSMGYGNMTSVINDVDRGNNDYQVAIVCGNNKRAKTQIEKRTFKKEIKVFGFVDNVDEFMDAADCIITKPGGLTVTESLAKELPMIYMDPIPGQEVKNVEFLVNNGAGIYVTKNYSLPDALDQFFRYPERKKEMQVCVHRLSKPESAKNLVDFIEKNNK